MGDFTNMLCSPLASGRGKIALKIAGKSSLIGLPSITPPSLYETSLPSQIMFLVSDGITSSRFGFTWDGMFLMVLSQ